MDIVQQTEQDLRARQIALEEESLTLGIDRYQKERQRQEEADSGPGRRLIRDTIAPLSQAIDAFVAEARNGKPGKKHTAVRWAEKFPSSELAYLTARHCLNAVSNGETRVQAVAEAIATSIEDSINYSRFREVSPGLYKHLQTVLKKSTSQRHSRNVMAAAMRRTELDQFAFPGHDGIHFGMKMVELFIEATGLAQLYNDSSHGKTRERVLLRGTEQVLDWLDKAHDAAAHFAPVRLPMLVPPVPWRASKGGGYLTDAGGLVPIVRTRNKAYLRELDNADMPLVYEALNAIQATPWKINTAVLEVMKEAWEAGGGIGDLPYRELEALPGLPVAAEHMDVWKEAGATKQEKTNGWDRVCAGCLHCPRDTPGARRGPLAARRGLTMAPSKMLRFKRRLWAAEVQEWRPKPGFDCHPLHATLRAMECIRHWVRRDARNGTVTAYGWDFREVSLEA